VRLTPFEEDRLLVFLAAELARRNRAAGLALNHPEAVALIVDAMHAAARAGADYAGIEAAGRAAVTAAELLPGVAAMLHEIRLEVLTEEGTRLVILIDPVAPGPGEAPEAAPGAVIPAGTTVVRHPERPRLELEVRNESKRVVLVSSHFPFHEVNQRLVFDRAAANGYRLDLPSGEVERWEPGETRRVRLVRYGGRVGAETGVRGGERAR
jgi:urease subunit gamma/beta